jgi:transposase
MTARKKYSKEFKLDAIALVVEQIYSRTEAAGNLVLRYSVVGSKRQKMMTAMLASVMAP